MDEVAFRSLSDVEQAVLKRLLEGDFPGAAALRKQSQGVEGRTIDSEGSLELQPPENAPQAAVVERVPIEGELIDRDGTAIRVLLHVVEGQMAELEVFRDAGGPPQRDLDAAELRVFSLKDPGH
jgi:hypothetical protein